MVGKGAIPEDIPSELAHKWEDLRHRSEVDAARRVAAEAEGLDPLERVAWFGAQNNSSKTLDEMVGEARKAGASWRSIAVALGKPASRESANRIRSRFNTRLS